MSTNYRTRPIGALTFVMRTHISITIDVEASIAGAFANPNLNPLLEEPVYGTVDGNSEGLGFLLNLFAEYGLKATFFVEALQHHYFGDEPMGRVVSQILAAGQDVQMHLHPCWAAFKGSTFDPEKVNDRLNGRPVADIVALLKDGLATFKRWNAPTPIAFRAGNLNAGRSLYHALRDAGFPLASNIGVGVFQPAEKDLRVRSGRHLIDDVLELPISTFDDGPIGKGHRPLQVTACSDWEMKAVLRSAREQKLPNLVVLTHPFEFFKCDGDRFENRRRNWINQGRLAALCKLVKQNSEDFYCVPFGEGCEGWLAAGGTEDIFLKGSSVGTMQRMIANKYNNWT